MLPCCTVKEQQTLRPESGAEQEGTGEAAIVAAFEEVASLSHEDSWVAASGANPSSPQESPAGF